MFPADIHIFNALIAAAPEVRDKYQEKWDIINVRSLLTVSLNVTDLKNPLTRYLLKISFHVINSEYTLHRVPESM